MLVRISILAGMLGIGAALYYLFSAGLAVEAAPQVAAEPIVVPEAPIVPETPVVPKTPVVAEPAAVAEPPFTNEPEAEKPAKPAKPAEPAHKRLAASRPRPELPEPAPRRTAFQQERWNEVNTILESYLPKDVAAKAALLLEDHCLERAAAPPPDREPEDTDESYTTKMTKWAIDTRSVGKASELHYLIPDAETKQKIYTPEFMGLLKASCPTD